MCGSWADGRRAVPLPPGDTCKQRRASAPLLLILEVPVLREHPRHVRACSAQSSWPTGHARTATRIQRPAVCFPATFVRHCEARLRPRVLTHTCQRGPEAPSINGQFSGSPVFSEVQATSLLCVLLLIKWSPNHSEGPSHPVLQVDHCGTDLTSGNQASAVDPCLSKHFDNIHFMLLNVSLKLYDFVLLNVLIKFHSLS